MTNVVMILTSSRKEVRKGVQAGIGLDDVQVRHQSHTPAACVLSAVQLDNQPEGKVKDGAN